MRKTILSILIIAFIAISAHTVIRPNGFYNDYAPQPLNIVKAQEIEQRLEMINELEKHYELKSITDISSMDEADKEHFMAYLQENISILSAPFILETNEKQEIVNKDLDQIQNLKVKYALLLKVKNTKVN